MIFRRGCVDVAFEAAFAGRFCGFPRSAATRLPYGHQLPPHHVQVRQSKGSKQPCGVLGKTPVAHFAEPPQGFHHVESVLAASSGCRAQTVEPALVFTLARAGARCG